MIHLIFERAATGSLKHALRKQKDKVIGFPIDFSVGPITNIHEKNGMKNYFTWLKSSYRIGWGYFKEDQTAYYQSLLELSEIEDGEQVTIWTCEMQQNKLAFELAVIC